MNEEVSGGLGHVKGFILNLDGRELELGPRDARKVAQHVDQVTEETVGLQFLLDA